MDKNTDNASTIQIILNKEHIPNTQINEDTKPIFTTQIIENTELISNTQIN